MYVLGIDVSRHNGKINHATAAAAGAKFVFIRCTVGDYYTDTRFAENWQGFKEAGMLVSAYMVPMPTNWLGNPIPARAQVEKFLDAFSAASRQGPGMQPDMPIAIDAEVDQNRSPQFLTALFEETGRLLQDFHFPYPYIYTRKTWWDPHILAANWWKNYPLWVAHYTTAAVPWLPRDWSEHPDQGPERPEQGTSWSGWQYTSKGDGHHFGTEEENIDLNRMQESDFFKYAEISNQQLGTFASRVQIGVDVYTGKLRKAL